VGDRREDVEDPVQLHRPAGVQLENIGPGHQHIDLIYFATPAGPTKIHSNYDEDKVGWYGPDDWDAIAVNAEVRGWCERALLTLEGHHGPGKNWTSLNQHLQRPANKKLTADG
jgi:hypothetical protein